MILKDRVYAFVKLGEMFVNFNTNKLFDSVIKVANQNNAWFTHKNIKYSLLALGGMLSENKIKQWIKTYVFNDDNKRVGVIIPSNIPLVGFYDFFCVLLSGNIFIGQLSQSNNILLPYIAHLLCNLNPEFQNYIFFEKKIKNIDMIIATGNDNSAVYFNYKYRSISQIIRKNRTSIAILSGGETDLDLQRLILDVYIYFGLGCRNVSKIYLPHGFDFSRLISSFGKFKLEYLSDYMDNYHYQKTIFKLNNIPVFDLNTILLVESNQIHAPISVLYYEYYASKDDLTKKVRSCNNSIQCIVSEEHFFKNSVSFGDAQQPQLHQPPDGVDIMKQLT